jgi:hypothetical protein
LTRAIYFFRTVPAMNSSVNRRAPTAVKGIIIKPEVRRSNLFTAAMNCVSDQSGEKQSRIQHTINRIIAEIFNQNFLQGVAVVPTRSVHGLQKLTHEAKEDRVKVGTDERCFQVYPQQ